MGYAVVDVETTGFAARRADRVVEVAVVRVDDGGRITDEWCTLVNPGRDLGPQHVHRISAADVWHAPSFAEVAGALAERLAGRVVVAHNLAFDARFLAAEFARAGVDVEVDGLCTMRLAGGRRSLAACCAAAGIEPGTAHSALDDARATALLFAAQLADPAAFPLPGRFPGPFPDLGLTAAVAEVRRGVAAGASVTPVPVTLARGDAVVFTGQTRTPRDVWLDRAASSGLVGRGWVTRSTRVLVAADPFTLSGKARRARAYRVPIVSEDDFTAM
ncbi:exonuclease domain-containing protein, partial [Saccharothrix sp. Mg75]|uniref:exonuclease domain-containing protein n=1 Tax=Saccharothrix sp. Mg75 TaxID=3445357 RepID=UPI003EE908FF